MDKILYEDFNCVMNADFIDWELLKGKTIFVTGATGLIGSSFIRNLDFVNQKKKLDISIIALVRNEKRAIEKFIDVKSLTFIVGTVEELPTVGYDMIVVSFMMCLSLKKHIGTNSLKEYLGMPLMKSVFGLVIATLTGTLIRMYMINCRVS